jgi:hypothetical protein
VCFSFHSRTLTTLTTLTTQSRATATEGQHAFNHWQRSADQASALNSHIAAPPHVFARNDAALAWIGHLLVSARCCCGGRCVMLASKRQCNGSSLSHRGAPAAQHTVSRGRFRRSWISKHRTDPKRESTQLAAHSANAVTNTAMHKSREKPCWTTASEPPYPNGGAADKIYNFLRSSPRALSVYVQGSSCIRASFRQNLFGRWAHQVGFRFRSYHPRRSSVLSSTTRICGPAQCNDPKQRDAQTNIHSAGWPRVWPSNLRSWC